MRNRHFFSFLARSVCIAAALISGSVLSAQTPNAEPPRLSDRAANELGKLRVLFEEKRFPELIAGLQNSIRGFPNPSYDRTVFSQALAQAFLQSGNQLGALQPIEDCIASGFLDPKTAQDFRVFAAQLNIEAKNPTRALALMDEWFRIGGTQSRDQQLFYAALLYEAKRFEDTLAVLRTSMARPERPTEQQLMMKYGALAETGRNGEAAEILELVAQLKPGSSTVWAQLLQSYLAAGENIRAIVTLERAMDLGHFAQAKDYFTLVGLYYNEAQFPQAAALIEKGFSSGKLPPEQQYWELLAGAWLQIGDTRKAAEVYGRAAKLVPGGEMDFSRAQILYTLGEVEAALEATQSAWSKGNFRKTPKDRVLRQLAGLALEARKVDVLRFAIAEMQRAELKKDAETYEGFLRQIES